MLLVLLTSSALTAAYAYTHCHMVAVPQDYLILAEAKLAAVLSSAFFFLGRPLKKAPSKAVCPGACAQIREVRKL